jgi:hypothetical protein
MEQTVFPAPAVAGILEGMVEARLHTDKLEHPELLELQVKMTGSYARPIYVVEEPASGQREMALMRAKFLSPGNFARFLESASSKVKLAGSPQPRRVASSESE